MSVYLKAPPQASAATQAVRHRYWRATLGTFVQNRQAIAGFVIAAVVILLTVLAPVAIGQGPLEQVSGAELLSPSWSHPFGTDEFGRDLLVRTVAGATLSATIGLVAVPLGLVAGVILGLIAGLGSHFADSTVGRIVDLLLAFPSVVLGLTIAAILGSGATSVAIAVAIVNIPIFSRLSRGLVLGLRSRGFVEASRTFGARTPWIVTRHILPNALPTLLVQLGISVATAVLFEAGLSFIGAGIDPPSPSLGNVLAGSQQYISQAPWYSILPGAVLTLVVLSIILMTDALRTSLDPNHHRQVRGARGHQQGRRP